MEIKDVFEKLKLKPEIVALGFNKDELMGIAASVANNLDSEATEEGINASIEAVIPFLKVAQSASNRVIEAKRKQEQPPKTETEPVKIDGAGSQSQQDLLKQFKEAISSVINPLSERLAVIENGKVTASRKSQLEEVLKDTGSLAAVTMQGFDRMKFENEEEFETYLSGVKSSVQQFNQEKANNDLSNNSKPMGGKDSKEGVDGIADIINAGTKTIVEQKQ